MPVKFLKTAVGYRIVLEVVEARIMTVAKESWIEGCLRHAATARIAVWGDFCLDAYWIMDADASEASVETGLPVRRVRKQQYSLGGAGNVVANLAALGVRAIDAIGLIGDDLYGGLMQKMLREVGANTVGLLKSQDDWQTVVFGKPYSDGREQSRIDFGGFNRVTSASIKALARELECAVRVVDLVILNQQVEAGLSTPEMIDTINGIISRHPEVRFIVDSRHASERYRGALLKINAHEAARVLGESRALDQPVTSEEARRYAASLFAQSSQPVFVTRGENGLVVADSHGVRVVPGVQISGRTDPVGAGDTTIAALAAALSGGADTLTAARFANLAASVVVRKIQQTGTASPDEIRAER